ncbi:hypothetical protein LTR93_011138 [Exophiala xenobiotica]|nr:hypothetical protein LTR93_011138 [Exophiala xenobiotica]
MPDIKDTVDGIQLNADLDSEEDLGEEKEEGEKHVNSEEVSNTVNIEEEMASLVFGSDFDPVSSHSETRSAASGEDKMTPALLPRTKKKSATTFGRRRSFRRTLAENSEIIENNSPPADLHHWPAKSESPIESTLSMLSSDMALAEASENNALDFLPAYSQKLYEYRVTLLRIPNKRRIYRRGKSPGDCVTAEAHAFSGFRASTRRRGRVLELFQNYRNMGGFHAPHKCLSLFIAPWNGLFEDLIRYLLSMMQALDLAMLSHLNEHLSTDARERSKQSTSIPARPAPTMSAEDILVLRPYRLACLDGLGRGRKVWMFHRLFEQPREPLCLSTSAHSLAAIWGPLWAVSTDENCGPIDHYNVGGGQHFPVEIDSGPSLLEDDDGSIGEGKKHYLPKMPKTQTARRAKSPSQTETLQDVYTKSEKRQCSRLPTNCSSGLLLATPR